MKATVVLHEGGKATLFEIDNIKAVTDAGMGPDSAQSQMILHETIGTGRDKRDIIYVKETPEQISKLINGTLREVFVVAATTAAAVPEAAPQVGENKNAAPRQIGFHASLQADTPRPKK